MTQKAHLCSEAHGVQIKLNSVRKAVTFVFPLDHGPVVYSTSQLLASAEDFKKYFVFSDMLSYNSSAGHFLDHCLS